MSVTLPYSTLGTGIADPSKIEANFNALATKFGNIDNTDVKSGAGIDVAKLSAQYEYMNVQLAGASTTAAGTTAPVAFCPMADDSQGNWTVNKIQYLLVDTGSTIPIFQVKFGYYTNGTTTWNNVTTLCAATSPTLADGFQESGTISITGSTIDPHNGGTGAGQLGLALFNTQAAVAGGTLYVTVQLKRAIGT